MARPSRAGKACLRIAGDDLSPLPAHLLPSAPMPPSPSLGRRLREVWPIAAFTAAYLAAAAAGVVVSGNREFVFYLGVMAALVALVVATDRHVRFGDGVLWGLAVWGLLHMAGGLLPAPAAWPVKDGGTSVLYNVWLWPGRLKYDHVVHAFGFGVTTWLCWQGLAAGLRARGVEPRPTGGLLLLCAAAGMGFGAANEVVEFAATLLVPETNVGGYVNTGWDLVSNLAGCVIAALSIRLLSRERRWPPPSRGS